MYELETYEVIVVGAGHAGCEAALAASRLGKKTLILTISMESVAMMPCNPSIGGTGKGQLVKEIDALGGEMGINIDKTFLQSRMLNRSKGPAVHSPRAQADKQQYHLEMKHTLERQTNLDLKQGEVVDLLFDETTEQRKIAGVVMKTGGFFRGKTVILATGTYLNGLVHVGPISWPSGPSGFTPSLELAENMKAKGFSLRRFKTGTPARALAKTLDYSKMQEQRGDEEIEPFSYMNDSVGENKISCWLTYTNPGSHEIVRANLDKTAPYGGFSTGVGPRYCPSIEDKVSRFPDRNRHQLFLEPEGLFTDEVYIQGMSTSLPEDIQIEFYRSIEGLEKAVFSRYAYAIEYECINPLSLTGSLEHRDVSGLFFAGQINGSSGYEEAAAQGLIAGINAGRKIDGKPPYTPDRSEAYIGVLIDDLVTKGTEEPYRIMTSRAEFRLLLRQDNADQRLTEKAYEIGLASQARYDRYRVKKEETEREIRRLEETKISALVAKAFLDGMLMDGGASEGLGTAKIKGNVSLATLLRRPEVTYEKLADIDTHRPKLLPAAARQAEICIKYAGYIEKQLAQVARFKKIENKRLPENLDYTVLKGLRNEAAQKLQKIRPASVGQASRISGVSPADVSVLLIHLARLEG
ncbi:MAG: tRNA uridine-5-carboxymethylaminomethyl(34) synthesis enzyme MnmG [Clostridiales Family XIII bacterium]|jgi:tRNA uridine 5-carboxymethylaminomethyl modification enzyme|nr:tRNA uridine-5-carboxymethylaminomethyl(34) synthesis enzyme MnmG [Clostridiales Family XIII bacterium]